MSTAILLLLSAATTPSYQAFGFPIADGKGHRVQVRQHDIRTTIYADHQEVVGLTVLRNDSDQPVKLRIVFPKFILVKGGTQEFAPFPVTYRIDGKPWYPQNVADLSPIRSLEGNEQWCPEGGIVEFGPRQTRSIRTSHQSDLGSTKDEFQKQLHYDLHGVSTWYGPVGQTNFSYKYTQNVVFNLPTMGGLTGWQVGLTGAFLRREQMSSGDHISVVYYWTTKD